MKENSGMSKRIRLCSLVMALFLVSFLVGCGEDTRGESVWNRV
jgi:hypothetical protein